MKQFGHCTSSFKNLLLFCTLLLVSRNTLGQTAVEIEVGGPWDYVSDGTGGIFVIAPNTGHFIALFSSDDATAFGSATDIVPDPGLHKLTLDLTDCGNPPTSQYKLYEMQVPAQAVQNALNAVNKRYGLQLPKPCYYTTRDSARAKISSTLPLPVNDDHYTTWMVFHYKVKSLNATLSLKPDHGPNSSRQVAFGNDTASGTRAISVVMALKDDGQDLVCDQFSAQAVDDSATLWGVQNLYRQFPMIDPTTRKQTSTYSSTCSPSFMGDKLHPSTKLTSTIRDEIHELRQSILKSQLKQAKSLLDEIQRNLSTYWSGQIPIEQQLEIESTRKLLDRSNGKSFTKIEAEGSLAQIDHMVSPGRTDCHKMQININGAVQ